MIFFFTGDIDQCFYDLEPPLPKEFNEIEEYLHTNFPWFDCYIPKYADITGIYYFPQAPVDRPYGMLGYTTLTELIGYGAWLGTCF